MKGIEDVLRDLTQLFESLSLPYVVMGGFAVRIHALPRPTYDIDFTLSISRDQLPRLYLEFEDRGYVISHPLKSGWIDSVKGMPVMKFQIYQDEHPIDIDVFLAETRF